MSASSVSAFPRGGLDGDLQRLSLRVDAGDFRAEAEFHALLFEQSLELFRDLAVHAGKNPVQKFDDLDLGAETPPHRAKLEPDHASADDQEFFRHAGKRKRPGRGNDALLVDLDAAQLRDVGAGRDHDGFGLDGFGFSLAGGNFHLARPGDFPDALKCVDLVLLEQIIDALHVAVDAFLLEFLHRDEIEFRLRDADPHAGEIVRRFLEQVRGVKQALRGNAADVEAGAAEGLFLLDHRVFSPSCAARIAQIYPPGPLPMTTTS